MLLSTRRRLLTLTLAALAMPTSRAQAPTFPSRSVTLIVPYPAGGPTDRHLRVLAEVASGHLGQQIVVENRPGASGTLGPSTMAMNAKADGYTISHFPLSALRYPHMQKTTWHPINDFTFICGLSGHFFGFVVRADSPFRTFSEYLEAARRQPGAINYGSAGVGASVHLMMEEIAQAAGVTLNHVPYKGNADMMNALLGGHVMAVSDASGWDRHVDAGRLRLLLTFGARPSKRWPEVPTARSLGFDVVGDSPYGLVGPKGMDPATVKVLQVAFRKAMDDPRHLAVLEQLHQEIWAVDGDEYRNWAIRTFEKDRALIERLGLAAK
ncbi:MAG: tripartite tricarboxylate transporter substrate binding protein [Rubrivivax sp.]|nr:tripartite tricarboxylate transporter substrate binding protein [Rubrivivax sp.]